MKKLIINVVLNLILFISNNETAVTLKYNKINEIEKREFYEVDYVHPEHHFIDGPQFIPVISNDKHKFPFLSITKHTTGRIIVTTTHHESIKTTTITILETTGDLNELDGFSNLV
jgi:hypothetical protein